MSSLLEQFIQYQTSTWEHQANEYRMYLETVIRTAGDYDPKYTPLVISVMRSIPVPVWKAPDMMEGLTDEQKEPLRKWYAKATKPNYAAILQEYINRLPDSDTGVK